MKLTSCVRSVQSVLFSSFLAVNIFCVSATTIHASSDLGHPAAASAATSFTEPVEIVHPCTDYGFKRAFKHPSVAMGFLNHILNLQGDDAIKDIQYLNTELQSSDPLGRHFTVDILCQAKNDRRFLLEMQNDFRSDYANKALTELCRLIAHWDAQVVHQKVTEMNRKRARTNSTLDEVKSFWEDIHTAIVVMVTNKVFPAAQTKESQSDEPLMEPEIINSYRLVHERRTSRQLGNIDARAVLVMLGNFKKSEDELITDLDRWLYTLKDSSLSSGVDRIPTYKTIRNIRDVTGDDVGLKDFYHDLDKRTVQSVGELDQYERGILEVNAIMANRMQEEYARGQSEKNMDIARRMLAEGMSIELIIKLTGVTEEQIRACQS